MAAAYLLISTVLSKGGKRSLYYDFDILYEWEGRSKKGRKDEASFGVCCARGPMDEARARQKALQEPSTVSQYPNGSRLNGECHCILSCCCSCSGCRRRSPNGTDKHPKIRAVELPCRSAIDTTVVVA